MIKERLFLAVEASFTMFCYAEWVMALASFVVLKAMGLLRLFFGFGHGPPKQGVLCFLLFLCFAIVATMCSWVIVIVRDDFRPRWLRQRPIIPFFWHGRQWKPRD